MQITITPWLEDFTESNLKHVYPAYLDTSFTPIQIDNTPAFTLTDIPIHRTDIWFAHDNLLFQISAPEGTDLAAVLAGWHW